MAKAARTSFFWLGLMVLAGIAGLVDSTLIHVKEIAAKSDPAAFSSCSINALINCASVASSKYAHFLGMPVSLMGIMFYEAIIVIGLLFLLGFKPQRWLVWTIGIVATLALLFSFRLLYYSYFGIGALCPYCLVSNLTSLIAVVSWFVYAAGWRREQRVASV